MHEEDNKWNEMKTKYAAKAAIMLQLADGYGPI